MHKTDTFSCIIIFLLAALIFLMTLLVNTTLTHISSNIKAESKGKNDIIKYKTITQNKEQSHTEAADEVIHFATTIIGTKFYNYGLILIKSIVFTTKKTVHFYIFTTDDSVDKILIEIQAWPKEFKSRLNVYKLDEYTGSDLHFPVGKNKAIHKKILAYTAVMRSPVIAQITSKLIYIDADLLALDDLWKLWRVFDTFDRNQTIAASIGRRYAAMRGEEVFLGLGVNAGLLLMDLGKLKQLSFMEEYLNISRYKHTALHTYNDQDLFCLYFKRFPEQHLLLPCLWNFRPSMNFCAKKSRYLCKEVEDLGVGLIHDVYPTFFGKGEFANVYTCFNELNFTKVYETVSCLRKAFEMFKNDSSLCHYQNNFLLNIENITNEYYP